MLQELAAHSGAVIWTIASMFFFLAAWVAVVVWVIRRPRDEMDARARLPLEGGDNGGIGIQDSGFREPPNPEP